MLVASLYLGFSLVCLMVYATIGRAVFCIHVPSMYEKCDGKDHISSYGSHRLGPSNHPDKAVRRAHDNCSQQENVNWFAFFCFFWPLVLAVAFVAGCSKGPAGWGMAIANAVERRRSPLRRISSEELRQLEIECGLTDAV